MIHKVIHKLASRMRMKGKDMDRLLKFPQATVTTTGLYKPYSRKKRSPALVCETHLWPLVVFAFGLALMAGFWAWVIFRVWLALGHLFDKIVSAL